jgi:hypothetical protein
MQQVDPKNFWHRVEDWRLRQHFKRVEKTLRRRDVSDLSPSQQAAREKQLECLHDYGERSIFPRNHSRNLYTPCFIDSDRRECAVAHLLMQSEQTQLVQSIVTNANYAYVPQMKFPELANWAAESGLTKEEVALIQPGYWSNFWNWLPLALPIWIMGIVALWLNAVPLYLKRKPRWEIFLSLLMAIPLIFIALLYLWEGTGAQYLSHAYDVPEYVHEAAGKDVLGLALGGLFSLFLAGLAVWLPFYRTQKKNKAKP